MKAALAKKPLIRIALVETDPLRFVGFRAVFHSERDFNNAYRLLDFVPLTPKDFHRILLCSHSCAAEGWSAT